MSYNGDSVDRLYPRPLNTTKQAPHDDVWQSQSAITLLGPNSNVAATDSEVRAPFFAIRNLFDHHYRHPADAASLNATYPRRGILKTAATTKTESDQKFTLDFSPARNARIPNSLRERLPGLEEILVFFNGVAEKAVPPILESLGALPRARMDAARIRITARSPSSSRMERPDRNLKTRLPPGAGVLSSATPL